MGWHCQNCGHWIVDRWDTCTYCGVSRYGAPSHNGSYGSEGTYSSHPRTKRSKGNDYIEEIDKYDFKSALIIAILLTVVVALPYNLIKIGGLVLTFDILNNFSFVFEVISIFIITCIITKIIQHRVRGWESWVIALFGSVLLLSIFQISAIISTMDFILVLAGIFVVSFCGIFISKAIELKHTSMQKFVSYAVRFVLVGFAIVIIANLTIGYSSYIASIRSSLINSSGANAGNNVATANSTFGQFTNLTTEIVSAIGTTFSIQTLNSTWANEFFDNVSTTRGVHYNYCNSLSDFATKRFFTMASNYGISHYGYDQDFQSYYGTIYNTAFGEEVFYPSGYSPKGYVNQIITTAPLHWDLLANSSLSYYGYYLGNGPTYSIYGPNGGYSICPVTEIPGPNIDIKQFFAQYGCSVTATNDTYFVMEIASSCP